MKFTQKALNEGWTNEPEDIRCMLEENILSDIRIGAYDIGEKLENVLAEYADMVEEFTEEEKAEIQEALDFEEDKAEAEAYREELEAEYYYRNRRQFFDPYERYHLFGEIEAA